jgi:hypothetical protein
MAQAFMAIHRAGVVMDVHSSGVGGGKTQDHLLATAEILRRKHAFAVATPTHAWRTESQVERAMQFADRVS